MPNKQDQTFSLCSDYAVRSLVMRLAQERMRQADQQGQPTLGRFGAFLSDANTDIRALAETMPQEGECELLSFNDVRELIEEQAEDDVELGGEDEMDSDDEEIELGSEVQDDEEDG